jgi:hypothetical protein
MVRQADCFLPLQTREKKMKVVDVGVGVRSNTQHTHYGAISRETTTRKQKAFHNQETIKLGSKEPHQHQD